MNSSGAALCLSQDNATEQVLAMPEAEAAAEATEVATQVVREAPAKAVVFKRQLQVRNPEFKNVSKARPRIAEQTGARCALAPRVALPPKIELTIRGMAPGGNGMLA